MGQIVLRSVKTEISFGAQKTNQDREISVSKKHEIPKVNLCPIKNPVCRQNLIAIDFAFLRSHMFRMLICGNCATVQN